jgi:hypothetical protein
MATLSAPALSGQTAQVAQELMWYCRYPVLSDSAVRRGTSAGQRKKSRPSKSARAAKKAQQTAAEQRQAEKAAYIERGEASDLGFASEDSGSDYNPATEEHEVGPTASGDGVLVDQILPDASHAWR